MTSTDTGSALLRAVCDEPEDMTHRLVYADWLDEQGQESRAELIRVQLHLHELGGYGACREPGRGDAIVCGECDLCVLSRRHNELLTPATFWEWFSPLVTAGHAWPGSPAVAIRGGVCEVGYFVSRTPARRWECHWTLTVRRGFVEGVQCPLSDWLQYSRDWWQMAPLRVYRPVTATTSPWDEIRQHGNPLLRDDRIGRLDTLDLSALGRLNQFQLSRLRFRPWPGLRRVILPREPDDYYRRTMESRWSQLLPDTRVEIAPAPAEEVAGE